MPLLQCPRSKTAASQDQGPHFTSNYLMDEQKVLHYQCSSIFVGRHWSVVTSIALKGI